MDCHVYCHIEFNTTFDTQFNVPNIIRVLMLNFFHLESDFPIRLSQWFVNIVKAKPEKRQHAIR